MISKLFKFGFPKSQVVKNTEVNNSTLIVAGRDVIIDQELFGKLELHKNDKLLLNQLVGEKLKLVEGLIICGKIQDAIGITDTLNTAQTKNLNDEVVDSLKYLKIILCLLSNDVEQAKAMLELVSDESDFKCKIEFLLGVEKNGTESLDITDEIKSDNMFSYVLLQILFRKAEWQFIVGNFEPSSDSAHIQDFFFALSSLNKFQCYEATKALDRAIEKESEPKYIFCRAIAQINYIMPQIAENMVEKGLLKAEYDILVEYGNICAEFRELNPVMFYSTKLRALLVLDLDMFLNEYNHLRQEFKEDVNFKFLLAVCYQGKKQYDDAITTYRELLPEGLDGEPFYRILLCLLLQDKFTEIITFYESECESQSHAATAIYLLAIGEHCPEKLDALFDKYFPDMCDDIEDMLYLINLCNYSTHIKETVYAEIKLCKELVCASSKLNKIHAGFLSVRVGDMELGHQFFGSVEEYTTSDLELIYANLQKNESDETKEAIAKWFVDNGFTNAHILNLLAECYLKKEKHYSAFSLLQRSFELEQHVVTADALINLAAMIDTVKIEDIQLYLDLASNEKDSYRLLNIAQTLCKFGQYEKTEKLIYEALYLLENRKDMRILELCLHVQLKMLCKIPDRKSNHDRIKDDVVVNLVAADSEEADVLSICINQEAAFGSGVEAIGVKHISKKDLLYLKLANVGLGAKIDYNGKVYKIKSITDKYVHAFWYVCAETGESGAEAPFKKIHIDVNSDVAKQMKKAAEEYGPNQNLLDSYHSSPHGLPIECINGSLYDDYVHIIQALLFSEGEVLYAGINNIRFNSKHNYTVSLSTLVVLKIQGQLQLVEKFKDRMYIPDTLLAFIKERSENSSQALVNSPGKLLFTEKGKGMLIPPDETMPDFWNSIYEYVVNLKSCNVTIDDRSILGKQTSVDMEEMFIKMKINTCQMDAIIVAKNTHSILLSDDLFHRKLAVGLSIENVNHMHLYNVLDYEAHIDAHMKLLKTNYVYIPPLMGVDDQFYVGKYIECISNNERKRNAYAELFRPIALSFADSENEDLL